MDSLRKFFDKIFQREDRAIVVVAEGEPVRKSFLEFVFKPSNFSSNGFQVTKKSELLAAEEVGGKGHNVIKLFQYQCKVPETFIIKCNEYVNQEARGDLSTETRSALINFLNPKHNYAVRSSANCEDGIDSAYAGKFDTILNVPGKIDDIIVAIMKCWKSLKAEISTVQQNGKMAVVIMRQIDSVKSGVLFQANPVTGSRASWVITANYGQGEGVVGGLAVDTYHLKANTFEIRKKNIVEKSQMYTLSSMGTELVPVSDEKKSIQCLTDAEILQVAKVGKKIRDKCNSPQDIEFSFDASGQLYILQTRPITTLAENLTWKAPDVGLWRLNGHLTTPMSLFYSPMWQAGQKRGGFACCEIPGTGVLAMDTCDINGFAYYCMRQTGPKAAPTSLPPPFVLRMILRLTAGDAIRVAESYWKTKAWRKFLDTEYPKCKEDWRISMDLWMKKLRDCPSMSNSDLSQLVSEAQDWGGFMYGEHARVTIYNLSPTGWFVIRATEILKCSPVDAFACIDGFSPISHGWIGEFEKEIKIIGSNDKLKEILLDSELQTNSFAAKTKLQEFQQMRVGSEDFDESYQALFKILEVTKYRLADGYDCANSTLFETPQLIFQNFADSFFKLENNTVEKSKQRGIKAGEELLSRVTNNVERQELEELLEEARLVSGLRDERAILTDLTACGIIHHILLECGKRLATRGHQSGELVDSSLIVFASKEEIMEQLLQNNQPPSPSFWDTLLKRKLMRQQLKINDAPSAINGNVLTPTREHFPNPYLSRSIETIIFALDHIFEAPDLELTSSDVTKALQTDKNIILGYAGSKGRCKGYARVITNAEDAAELKVGEICVTQYPSSLINMILHKAGGIVTDFGGILCHAAICARESEIPCVVGCHTATSRIKTGDLIEVDGSTGIVNIV